MAQLNVVFIWHMHQPWYVWPDSDRAALPFARLHACSSYLNMPWLVQQFADTRVTFNLVPSLTEQLIRYADGSLTDHTLELCRRDAADLTAADRQWLLTRLTAGHATSIMEASGRYRALLHKRGLGRNEQRIEEVAATFTVEEMRDVQVWLNLIWCGYALRAESPTVRALIAKDHHFTEAEKHALLDEMQQALQRVLPLYRQLVENGQCELTTSPFYHPILPLLCNMRDAARRIPPQQLPPTLWREPGEAYRQLQRAREHHRHNFGAVPVGLWPSEGAVSDAALEEVRRAGFHWLASDEQVLAQSLQEGTTSRPAPTDLYRIWAVGDGQLHMLFRDHELSDLIGFVYRNWRPTDAAEDLVGRLRSIARALPSASEPQVVCIALDGENPWGLYPDGGEAFLRRLYAAIERAPELRTATPAELTGQTPSRRLQSVFPGSWIAYSYATWIGGDQHRRAWTLLRGALEAVQRRPADAVPDAAIEHLMIAEGSDWFWWYSTDHYTPDADLFDGLFRANVRQVYRELGEEPPAAVSEPIAQTSEWHFAEPAVGTMEAIVDGRVTHYFEWRPAALLRTSGLASAMHRTDSVICEIYVGHEPDAICLRADPYGNALTSLSGHELCFEFQVGDKTLVLGVAVPADPSQQPTLATRELALHAQVAVDRVVEARVSLAGLGAQGGDTIGLAVSLHTNGHTVERWPETGFVSVQLPTADDLESAWFV